MHVRLQIFECGGVYFISSWRLIALLQQGQRSAASVAAMTFFFCARIYKISFWPYYFELIMLLNKIFGTSLVSFIRNP